MDFHQALVEKLIDVCDERISAKEAESWLLGRLQAILESADSNAIALANEVDALFVEQSEGLLDSAALRHVINRIVARERSTIRVVVGAPVRTASLQQSVTKKAVIPDLLTTHRETVQVP